MRLVKINGLYIIWYVYTLQILSRMHNSLTVSVRSDADGIFFVYSGVHLRGRFRVILCLGVPEFVVFAVCICKQAVVGTLLDHAAIVEYGDFIAELAGGQTVADIDSRLVA